MKKSILMMAAVAALLSCTKEISESEVVKPSENKEYTIGLMPMGDIVSTYSPLTKSGEVETVWYGINIKRDGSDYLMGLYDDISQFKVQLSTEHSYSFEISAVKSDVDFLQFQEVSSFHSCLSSLFPFDSGHDNYWQILLKDDCYSDYDGNKVTNKNYLKNKMKSRWNLVYHYDDRWWHAAFDSFPNLKNGKNSNEWYRFYGTKTSFTPSKDETLPFTLKHEGFGLQYSVSGICDGSVSVVIDNAQETDNVTYFSQPAIATNYTSPQKVIEFRDMTEETEQVKVTVVWTRGNNVVDNLGSTTVNVRRNKVNKINITLGEHSSSKSMSVTTDASDYFGNESSNITI